MRRSLVIAAVLLALAFVLVGGPSMLLSLSTGQFTAEDPAPEKPTPDVVSFDNSERVLGVSQSAGGVPETQSDQRDRPR